VNLRDFSIGKLKVRRGNILEINSVILRDKEPTGEILLIVLHAGEGEHEIVAVSDDIENHLVVFILRIELKIFKIQ
jgi:hypothetical protein